MVKVENCLVLHLRLIGYSRPTLSYTRVAVPICVNIVIVSRYTHLLNKYNSNVCSHCGPGTCISFLFTRCHYILLLTDLFGLNLKIWHSTKIWNIVTNQ